MYVNVWVIIHQMLFVDHVIIHVRLALVQIKTIVYLVMKLDILLIENVIVEKVMEIIM